MAGALIAAPSPAAPQAPAPAQAPVFDAPVAEVRVAFDADGVIAVEARGVADLAAARAVTLDDPVRVASISKLVVALAVLRLVEDGALDLDADVSEQLGWPLRHPRYPSAPISLRLLLSHRSGITDGIDYVLPLDADLREALGDGRAWDDAHPPGTFFRYANLNLPVVAAVLERATGQRFDQLMRRLVLAPLKLDACFGWTSCEPDTVARRVVLYGDRRRPVYDRHAGATACAVTPARDGSCDLGAWRPGRNGAIFSPQGGLRISARGLAKVGRLLLGRGQVDGVRLLSERSIAVLESPLWTYDGTNGVTASDVSTGPGTAGFYCSYGLGVTFLATPAEGCRDDPFGDGIRRIGHAGDAYGLRSGLWIDAASGVGVAYFATGIALDAPEGRSAFKRVEERLARGE